MSNEGRQHRDRAAPVGAIFLIILLAGAGRAAAQQGGNGSPFGPGINKEPARFGARAAQHTCQSERQRLAHGSATNCPARAGVGVAVTRATQPVRLAQVTVTVTDQNGRYITGLQKDDFRTRLSSEIRSFFTNC
jgi:hypothetical protein